MARLNKNKLFFEGKSKSFEAEKIRSAQVSIQFALSTLNKAQTIMFTSANKGEGKTFCISNIAKEYAKLGKKVLLVDLDLHRPRLSQAIAPREAGGIMLGVRDMSALANQILPLTEENLFFLPTGPLPSNPMEVVSSGLLAEVFTKLEGEFDMIFIDTPPLRVLSDGRMIATLCDGVVLVVRNGMTKLNEVEEAKVYIENAGVPIVGAILNGQQYNKKEKNTYAYY
ncbi:CpsD/CapB family tyrosine-protein kinase [Paenilisteria rocourtiae]|uniref:non-specific protein-tyrosine kinase n=1 Tax=Listeria rocourtiae TaxID=647910 RepID=A0A4R6ZPS7_9LIST|nr:CpsD/CapB family tyrosine-protein kinase [Listeria rocourtiae]EUJ44173.1 capsular polysaccharide biosynthesis protein [Listeria rocourtiae FSL F6-920]MBC1604057.1 CpsD/CapB family tyrosine-protein kinase [Listeria rocourtiae]TDR54570.1 capsular exopolysaccharide synthesis family protein [Listeria rocourtiae]